MSAPPGTLSDRRGQRVLMVLPPDFEAPEPHRRHRFPHQGPALVAASVRPDGVEMRAVDLDLALHGRPTVLPPRLLDDDARLEAHLAGQVDDELVAFSGEMLARLGDVDVDAFALSLDRHTQIKVTLLLAVELKRMWGRPVLVGGSNAKVALAWLRGLGARGVDFVTDASSPGEIRRVFRALADVAQNRWELPVEPLAERVTTAPDDWPTPDFSIYDLALFRRDPFRAEGARSLPAYDGSVGPRLFLPYHFTFDCQYACVFCERGGTQTSKSPERVVRDLATLSETFECRDFMLFDAQINLLAEGFSRALIDARLGLHWTDSYRVAPRRPEGALDLMAEAGCVGLTFGVESASDRMLKRMVKGHTTAKATRIVHDAHAREMFVRVNMLPCFPGETPDDHAASVAWIEEHALAIDDLAASSFYLAEGSPVGQLAERFGIVIRGARELKGDHKFRKNLGSLAYDEIGGLSWEEREARLRPAEDELMRAWRRGRASIGRAITQPGHAFALRRDVATKAEAYARFASWSSGARPEAELTARSQRPMPSTAELAASSPEEEVDPTAPPAGSLRARASTAVSKLLSRHGFTVVPSVEEPARLSLALRDREGRAVTVVAERARADAPVFRRGARVAVWYQAAQKPEPPWTSPVVSRIADLLCSPQLEALADELVVRLATLSSQPARSAEVRRYGVVDLVRMGLKPAASFIIDADAATLSLVDDLPAKALSRVTFSKNDRDDLLRMDGSKAPAAKRMVYVGRSIADVERLREIDELLLGAADGARLPDVELAALHAEFGRLMGFPACCAAAFSATGHANRSTADIYFAVRRLGWHQSAFGWRYNHPAALLYELPFLLHVPCSAACEATYALVESLVARLYAGDARRVVEEVLSQGIVLFPDDRAAFFRPTGRPDAFGVQAVSRFNVDAHPSLRGAPRPPERCVPADAGGYPDADVDALRTVGGRVELRVRGAWRPYEPSAASRVDVAVVLLPDA